MQVYVEHGEEVLQRVLATWADRLEASSVATPVKMERLRQALYRHCESPYEIEQVIGNTTTVELPNTICMSICIELLGEVSG